MMIIVFIFSCTSKPGMTRQERIDWINANSNEINRAIVLFEDCHIKKMVWSNDGFITILDKKSTPYSMYINEDLSPTDNIHSALAPKWERITRFYEYSTNLGINGIEQGLAYYIHLPGKTSLFIIDDADKYNIASLARHRSYFKVMDGWYYVAGAF